MCGAWGIEFIAYTWEGLLRNSPTSLSTQIFGLNHHAWPKGPYHSSSYVDGPRGFKHKDPDHLQCGTIPQHFSCRAQEMEPGVIDMSVACFGNNHGTCWTIMPCPDIYIYIYIFQYVLSCANLYLQTLSGYGAQLCPYIYHADHIASSMLGK